MISDLLKKHSNVPYLRVTGIAEEGNYVLASWRSMDRSNSGQALARRTGTDWVLVQMCGGSLADQRYLERLGVPPGTAYALVNDVRAL